MKLLSSILLLLVFSCTSSDEVMRLKSANEELNTKLNECTTKLNDANADVIKLNFLKRSLSGLKVRFVTDMGTMEAELYPQQAPLHVAMFVSRVESGFYNGLQFHRVIPGFMIQGGDPNSRDDNFRDDGGGGPAFMTPHEFNSIKHTKGVLSTARVGDIKVGAGSQFFLMHDVAPHLDNQYTVFGKVFSGLDIIDKIVSVEQGANNHPIKAVRIQKAEVFK